MQDDDERPAESNGTESEPPAKPPHKFFFGRGVSPKEIARMLLAEYDSRDENRLK